LALWEGINALQMIGQVMTATEVRQLKRTPMKLKVIFLLGVTLRDIQNSR